MLKYILIGLLGGILGGMGMGGGTLLIPLLTIFCNTSQVQAQGYNLLCFLPMAVITLIIHAKNKLLKVKCLLPFIFSGVVFSIIGSILANLIGNKLKIYFSIFLIMLGVYQIIQFFISKKRANTKKS